MFGSLCAALLKHDLCAVAQETLDDVSITVTRVSSSFCGAKMQLSSIQSSDEAV